LGFHGNLDTFCSWIECDLDIDFATCCNVSESCAALGRRFGENVAVPIEATVHSECCITSMNTSAKEVLYDDGEGYGMLWLGPDEEMSWFVLDLGDEQEVVGFSVRNTMNRQYYDRWTTDFTVDVSVNLSTWVTAVSGTLEPDLLIHQLPTAVQRLRYVRFTMQGHGPVGGGLQYFAALREVPGPCPVGTYFNEEDFCSGSSCIEIQDRYRCCQEAAHCNGLGRCPYSFVRKEGDVYCNGPKCSMTADRDFCCDKAEPCEGLPYDDLATSLPCPLGYVSKGNMTSDEPWRIFCDGKYCEVGRDRDICCDVAMNCVGNYACPHGYTPKLIEAYCDGVECIPGALSRDRDFCCDEAMPCMNLTCSYGFVHVPDTYCFGVTCIFDRDFSHCCEAGLLFTHYKWSVTTLRYAAADAMMVAEIGFFHHGFKTSYEGATAFSIDGNSPDNGLEDPVAAIDGLSTTKWLDYDATPIIIQFDKGVAIDSYAFQTALDLIGVKPFTSRDPIHWTLEASLDGQNYTLIGEVTQGDQEVTLDEFGLGGRFTIFGIIVHNLDYSRLAADAGILHSFNLKLLQGIRFEAEAGITDEDIDVVLSAGNRSVVAKVTINPKTFISPSTLRDKLDKSLTLEQTILDQLNIVPDIDSISFTSLVVEVVRPVLAEDVSEVPQARGAWTKYYATQIPCASPEAARIAHSLDPTCKQGNVLQHGEECTMLCEVGYSPSISFLNCSMGERSPFTFECLPDVN
jgi:hypothetical protein